MATYVPNATQTSEPLESRTVESAALEFRTLKTSVNSRISAEETTRGNADTNLQGQITALSGAIVGGAVAAIVTSQEIVGDGVTATYTLSASVDTSLHVDLYIDGAHQQPSSYTVVLDQLTLSEVPHDGALMTVKIGKPIGVGVSDALLVEYTPAGTGAVATTVQAKLRESVSVLDFGAVPGTDCTAEILAAIAANANGAIIFPPGTYLVSAVIENTTSCSMYGYGKAVIKLADGVNLGSDYQDRVVWFHDCDDVVIDGITIDENKRGGTFATGSLLLTRCNRAKVTNNLIYDNDGMGITCGGEFGSNGNCQIVLIEGNTVYPLTQGTAGTAKSQEGIKTAGNRRITISNNYVRTFYDDGITLNGYYTSSPTGYDDGDRDIIINGNIIEAWSRSIAIDGWCENIVITNNTCRKMAGSPIEFAQPLILFTNVIGASISTSYARNVTITGNVCEINTDYSTACAGITITCGVNFVISNNSVRSEGSTASVFSGIEVVPTSPTVKTIIGVLITGNSIQGFEHGVYVAASEGNWPIDIVIDGNQIQNISNPITLIGTATLDKNWSVSNNKTNSPNAINWSAGVGDQQGTNNTWNYGSAAPTTGTWSKGQIVWNNAPAFAQTMGWMNVTSGDTPGGFGPDFEFRPMAVLS